MRQVLSPKAPTALKVRPVLNVPQVPKGPASTRIPSQQDGIPWQAVTPNSANPIVWRPGQPISVLARNLARYPKGTTLERDSEGNIRAVLPRGTKVTPPAKAPVPPRGGHPPANGGKRPAGTTNGQYPPGWGPDSRAIASSLLKVPGVRSASPVWGTRYQIATTLSAAQIKALPGVKAVAPNNLMAFSSLPETNDPDLSDEYYLANAGQTVLSQAGTSGDSADFSYAWARSRGSGVVIADIDTGVDLTNPDLSGQILASSENFSVSPPTSDVQAEGSASGFYHATTVDGVMVAIGGNGWGGAGAAPEAKVLALKCSDNGSLADSCIYAAGEYAITQHVQVINMSFGEAVSSDATLASLVSDAETAGILVTASAGNAGTDNDSSPVLPANYATTYPNVISVGATDNQDNLASYSDYGATTVDVMAPGTDMFTDYPTYSGFDNAYVSGTSYAAPMVASTAALLWSVDPSLTYAQVKNDILTSVHDVAGLSSKCVTGGVVDAQAALALVNEPVQFSFTGFDEVVPSQVAQVSISASAQAGALPSATPLGYHLELLYNYSGTMYDVVDQALDWSMGGGGAQASPPPAMGQRSSRRPGSRAPITGPTRSTLRCRARGSHPGPTLWLPTRRRLWRRRCRSVTARRCFSTSASHRRPRSRARRPQRPAGLRRRPPSGGLRPRPRAGPRPRPPVGRQPQPPGGRQRQRPEGPQRRPLVGRQPRLPPGPARRRQPR